MITGHVMETEAKTPPDSCDRSWMNVNYKVLSCRGQQVNWLWGLPGPKGIGQIPGKAPFDIQCVAEGAEEC